EPRPGGGGSRQARHGWRAPESGQEALTEGKAIVPRQDGASSRSERTATRLPPQRAWASTGAYEAALNGLFDENRPGEGDHEGLARIPGLPPSSRTCSMPIQKPLVVAL